MSSIIIKFLIQIYLHGFSSGRRGLANHQMFSCICLKSIYTYALQPDLRLCLWNLISIFVIKKSTDSTHWSAKCDHILSSTKLLVASFLKTRLTKSSSIQLYLVCCNSGVGRLQMMISHGVLKLAESVLKVS